MHFAPEGFMSVVTLKQICIPSIGKIEKAVKLTTVWAVFDSTEISAILLKYPTFKVGFIKVS